MVFLDFKSVKKFKIFNTNNLWIKLSAIKDILDNDSMEMEVIENVKMLENDLPILQLETAVGAAIKNFKGSLGIKVNRSRFLPVKKTSDLLLVMSNLYQLKEGALTMNALRHFETPVIKLAELYFSKVRHFLSRFESIPNMLELDHLTVSGDVVFGKNITLKGTVLIVASEGEHIDIPEGAIIENKIISGNFRIIDV